MSRAQRLEARNAKTKQRQAVQKIKEPVLKNEPTQDEVKSKLKQLQKVWMEAMNKTKEFMKMHGVDNDDNNIDFEAECYLKQESSVTEEKITSTLRFMPARTIRNKTREAHFAGPDSTAVNIEYQKVKMVEKKAHTAFLTYRSSYDKQWIADQKENQAKINLFKTVYGGKFQEPKKKLFEIIHKLHSNPLDKSSDIICRHYDRDTWKRMNCDCEKTYKCGCVETFVCMLHNVSICECSITQLITKSTISKCQDHLQDPMLWLLSSDMVNMKPSLRARARLGQNKLAMANFGTTKIKVVRNSVGSILVKNEDGTLDERTIRCYHSIIPTGDMIPCDCSRDANNRLQLSEKMQQLPKDDIVLDETYLQLQRKLVCQSESDKQYFLNPSGFAGSLRPEYGPVHPAKVAQEEAMVAQAVKMHLFE